jgi:Skp family chaperone for outer membrane proteins
MMFGLSNFAQAQLKIAYVNSDRILSEYDEAREAQSKLDIEAKKLKMNIVVCCRNWTAYRKISNVRR